MAKKPLSDRQYITRSGSTCPVCHQQMVAYDGEFTQYEDPIHAQRLVVCRNPKCGATWCEEFELKKVCGLRDGKGIFIQR